MLLKENIVEEQTHSEYETERNKPMPNRIHGKIQGKIVYLLISKFEDKYEFSSEVTLKTVPNSTPDICIFPKKVLDWKEVEAKESEAPITTVEIISPSQSIDEMIRKILNLYFPFGIKSAWLVMPPPMRAICVVTPDGKKKFYDSGILTDPVTGIEMDVDMVFEGMK